MFRRRLYFYRLIDRSSPSGRVRSAIPATHWLDYHVGPVVLTYRRRGSKKMEFRLCAAVLMAIASPLAALNANDGE